MTRYTRSGKIVGSYRMPHDHFFYVPAVQGYSCLPNYRERGYMTYAPSGAQMHWFADEADALLWCAEENRKWNE